MKKLISLIAIVLSAIVFISCSNTDFTPYGEYQEKYVMNCILHPDSSYQIVTLNKTYMVNNYEPISSTEDTFVKGALVRLWNGNDEVVILRDTILPRAANDPYKKPFKVYYTKNFKPKVGFNIQIEALLPNGKRLTSSTFISKKPMLIEPVDSIRFYPKDGIPYAGAKWQHELSYAVFAPKATIVYMREGKFDNKIQRESIPAYINNVNGIVLKEYPQPSGNTSFQIDTATINYSLRNISAGDPEKNKYRLFSLVFDISVLDDNLSLYFNSTSRGKDMYSVVLDETDYSNIKGGFGVFGTYTKYSVVIPFSSTFLFKLGYRGGFN